MSSFMGNLQNEYNKVVAMTKQKLSLDDKSPSADVESEVQAKVVGASGETPTEEDQPTTKSPGYFDKITTITKTYTEKVVTMSKDFKAPEMEVIKKSVSQSFATYRDDLQRSEAMHKFDKFIETAKEQKKQFSEKEFTLWKKPEPLRRPEGLQLTLIGVALFSGNEIFSKAIRKFTHSKFSHVALLMQDVTKEKMDPDGWYVYSANGSAGQILDDHRLPQVQLEKWTEAIASYDGGAATRMALFHQGAEPDPSVVTELVDKYLGLPYETQISVMLKALRRANVEGVGHADSAFCSEICYRFLVTVGAIDDTEIAENVWPKDFSDEKNRIKLHDGVWADIIVAKGSFPNTNYESYDRQDSVVKM